MKKQSVAMLPVVLAGIAVLLFAESGNNSAGDFFKHFPPKPKG